jgi:hypothetical protein
MRPTLDHVPLHLLPARGAHKGTAGMVKKALDVHKKIMWPGSLNTIIMIKHVTSLRCPAHASKLGQPTDSSMLFSDR